MPRRTTACASRSTTTTVRTARSTTSAWDYDREDGEALWHGLAGGRLSTLATDEYTTSFAVKMAGRVVVEDGRLLGTPRDGRFVVRKLDPEVLSRPVF
jgi:hypothetical protein